MIKRKKGEYIFSPTGRRFDPTGQNATEEELVDVLAQLLVDGMLELEAQRPGMEGEQARKQLQDFRFRKALKDPYSTDQEAL